jgi:hypothetical protein
MDKLTLAALAAAVSILSIQTPAHAGACSEEIAKLHTIADESQAHRFVGPTEGQTVGAQLHHQPTPESIAAAETNAVNKVGAVLKRAESFDAAGKETDCMASVGEARLLLGLE